MKINIFLLYINYGDKKLHLSDIMFSLPIILIILIIGLLATFIEPLMKPLNSYGGNMGKPNYLYLTSDPQDALWFAQEKGCNTIVEVSNITINYLKPDPDDEAGFTMEELLDRMKTTKFPSKFILNKPLEKSYFKLYDI